MTIYRQNIEIENSFGTVSENKITQHRLLVQNFRAVKEANIALNGITVVAGENGSGKSTLSKFLYYTVKNINEYNRLIEKDLKNNLHKNLLFLREYSDFTGLTALRIKDYDKNFKSFLYELEKNIMNDLLWYKVIDEMPLPISNYGVDHALKETMRKVLNEDKPENEWKDLWKSKIQQLFTTAREYKEKRPFFLFRNQLNRIYPNFLPERYKFSEFHQEIISDSNNTVSRLNRIATVVYIDTPMIVGIENTGVPYWNDLNKMLQDKYETNIDHPHDEEINDIIKKEILKGDAYLEEDTVGIRSFKYRREDGKEFDLLECATGIRSFAILQMLLKKGILHRYTLLIMDEPEVHLHPQWIIEFARLIVLLNKYTGVKFFIASHHPDIVAAIKYISEKEKTDDNLNFYLAQKEESSFTYSYRHLGTDIEAIFESFNIALNRINQYGGLLEEE